MSFLDNLWYGKSLSAALIRVPLLPFSAVFGVVSAFRRSLYANGFLKQIGPVVPVVVVGGITVGGTGKTPTVIALVNELKDRGFKPGVLTRGYKAQCPIYPSQVPMDADPVVFGDEPVLIRRSTGVPVVIDPVRTRGADYLAGLEVDVIITDDGMQHYALDREVEICVLDGSRMMGNGHLLPAGPLREAEWRLKTVSSIVVSGAVAQLGHTPMMLRPSAITALNPDNNTQLDHRGEVTALCGIGNPDRFYKTLEDCGFNVVEKVEVGDHNKLPFDKLQELASKRTVIMTAKDAIKYRREAKENNLENAFVLNVAAQLSNHFFDDIVGKIKLARYRVEQRRKKREAEGYVLQKVESIDDNNVAAEGENIVKTAARLSAEQQNAELAKARQKAAIEADAKKAAAAEAMQQPLWVPSVPSMSDTFTATTAPASAADTAAVADAAVETAAEAAVEAAVEAASSTASASEASNNNADLSKDAAVAIEHGPLWVPSVPSSLSSSTTAVAAVGAEENDGALETVEASEIDSEEDSEVATVEAETSEAEVESNSDADAATDSATTTTTRSRRKTSENKESAKDKAEDEEASTARKTTKRTTKSTTAKATTTRKKSSSTSKSKAAEEAEIEAASNSSTASAASASESATVEKDAAATKTTARKTVRKTTRTTEAKDGKDIFSLKKMRNNYDPNALPKELKRKTPKTKAATDATATKEAAEAKGTTDAAVAKQVEDSKSTAE